MRRSRFEAARTRREIVAAASRLFRAQGIGTVSIATSPARWDSRTVGSTATFQQEALVVEALEAASLETAGANMERLRQLNGRERAAALIDTYLSDVHRANPQMGCPVSALCSDMRHESAKTRAAFTVALQRLVTVMDSVLPPQSKSGAPSCFVPLPSSWVPWSCRAPRTMTHSQRKSSRRCAAMRKTPLHDLAHQRCWRKSFRTKENPMSRAAISVFVYSIFLIGQGLVLLLIPTRCWGACWDCGGCGHDDWTRDNCTRDRRIDRDRQGDRGTPGQGRPRSCLAPLEPLPVTWVPFGCGRWTCAPTRASVRASRAC